MRSYRDRITTCLLVCILLITMLARVSGAANNAEVPSIPNGTTETIEFGSGDAGRKEPYFIEMRQKWIKEAVATGTTETVIDAASYVRSSDDAGIRLGDYQDERNVLIWSEPKGWVEYEFDAPTSALYEMWIEYSPVRSEGGGGRQSAVASVEWNGSYPYVEARSIPLPRSFAEQRPEKINAEGEQIRSLVDEREGWRTVAVYDSEGASAAPLIWHTEQGRNTIRFTLSLQPAAIKSIILKPVKSLPSYEEYKKNDGAKSSGAEKPIVIEAENTSFKSSTSVLAQYDRDPLTTPKSLDRIRYNTFGGTSWSRGGVAATWEVEVPADGLYKIAFRAKQNFSKNLTVFRTIKINNEVPFREWLQYPFEYRNNWDSYILRDDKNSPFELYLKKGSNTLAMTSTYEPYMPMIVQIENIVDELKEISIYIRKATGNREDPFREFNLEKDIPGVLERFERMEQQLNELVDHMLAINGKHDNVSLAFQSAVKDVRTLLDKPNRIPNSQLDIGTLQEKLELQRTVLMSTPLELDKIYVQPAGEAFPKMKASWTQKLKVMAATLFHSFKDRNQINKQRDDELNVWMMWGRDYVEELQQLADSQFTPQYGIKVNINLMQTENLLILGKAAGILPDVALGVPAGMPFELAVRNAGTDISKLPGAAELLNKYSPGSLVPYYYKGGYYAIPETMNFKVLFYRKDIMDTLGLKVPDTWNDVYAMLPTLLQNDYSFYVDPGDYSYLFFQNGAEFYSPDGITSELSQPEAFQAFNEWTDLFNFHGLERQVMSFYNNFRKGTMPIGISDYNQYMQLLVAAPEIRNEWAVAPIPGKRKADGTVERWFGGVQAVGSMLFPQSSERKQDLAWEFLQWYLSDEVQTEFGLNLEQYGGEAFRWNSGNINAFVQMPWEQEDLNVFLEQWRWIKEIPPVPGGYMTGREIGFAWNRTIINGEPPRFSLEKAVIEVQRELERKQREFGLIDDKGNILESLKLPQINKPWKGVEQFVK